MAVAAVVGVGALLIFGSRSPGSEQQVVGRQAPPFTLMSTGGNRISLSDYAGQNVLLYFNEGVGCDACFYQTVELEQHAQELSQAGIIVLPIVVNPMQQVKPALDEFGITWPYLIDADSKVSAEYGALGTGMHANLPGHGFVLIDRSGEMRWSGNYPSMYISTGDLLSEIRPYLS